MAIFRSANAADAIDLEIFVLQNCRVLIFSVEKCADCNDYPL